MQLDTVLIVIYGVYLIRDQLMTMGALIGVVILSSRVIAPMGQVVALISNFEQTRIAFESLNSIMNRATEAPAGFEFIRRDSIDGALEFRDVTFTYPGSERPALENVSFTIKKGQRVALLGRTGSGKTTIQKILLGFYKPQKGSVRIDDLDASQLNPFFIRRNVMCVPQDFSLFSGTLRENVALKQPNIDDTTVIEAIKIGGLEQFMKASPRGLEMPIEERGANLSGGQRQGVAVARAFVCDSPVVLLDEPTSSMDATTEIMVIEMLKKRVAGRTLVLTTHKPMLLDLVERVIVLEGGRVAFDGDRAEFAKKFVRQS